ncbi:MAG: transporter-like protein [Rhizorhabdus sp.]|nr:transporter-like protein [Rhizorhabdus sp.]
MVTIAIEGLSVSLGRRRVLRDIDVALEPGQMIGVIGPNGAGKSTFARAILALLKPDAGRVRIDKTDVARMKRTDLARLIAYLPQGQAVHWPLTVERLVALGRLPHLAPFSRIGAADHTAIEQAMAMADVLSLRDRIATELSGGEQARALLARALAVEAPALIADEPLASLDPGHQIEVMGLLQAQARRGALVVTVLHDLTMAARFCDRLLVIDKCRLVAEGPPRDVLTPELLSVVYGVRAVIAESQDLPLIVPIERG